MAGGQLLDYAPRILIVDDDPDVRTFFDRVLSEDGYYVDAGKPVRLSESSATAHLKSRLWT